MYHNLNVRSKQSKKTTKKMCYIKKLELNKLLNKNGQKSHNTHIYPQLAENQVKTRRNFNLHFIDSFFFINN